MRKAAIYPREKEVTVVDTARVEFNEYYTIEEIIKKDLEEKFKKVSFDGFGVASVKSVKVSDSGKMETHPFSLYLVFDIEVTYDIKYLNPGDVIFYAQIGKSDKSRFGRVITNAEESPFNFLVHGIPSDITYANVSVVKMTTGAPKYLCEPAIFPRFQPIIIGEKIGKGDDSWKTPYNISGELLIKSPKKEILLYIDPLADAGNKRVEVISTVLRSLFAHPNAKLINIKEYVSGKPKKFSSSDIDPPCIVFLPISEVEKIKFDQEKYFVELAFHPVMFLDRLYVACLFATRKEWHWKFDEKALSLFLMQIKEYYAMKKAEYESMVDDKTLFENVKKMETLYAKKKAKLLAKL